MAYWLIVLILALALAPLWQFLPTRRQRDLARLREAAALSGLFVEFRDLPLPSARRERLPAAERQVLYYGLRLPAARRARREKAAWWRENGVWRGERALIEPPPIAAEMPDAVLAIAVSESSCGCYWREQGDVDVVHKIAALLERWSADIATAD